MKLSHLLLRIEDRSRTFLSRHPLWYALIAGFGVVLFWRGAWHTTDALAAYLAAWHNGCPTTDLVFLLRVCTANDVAFPLDGLISIALGSVIMLVTGVFVSELLGKEIIISGLRGEKRLTERTEVEVRTETGAIGQIQHDLRTLIRRLDRIEKRVAVDDKPEAKK